MSKVMIQFLRERTLAYLLISLEYDVIIMNHDKIINFFLQ